jgi:hypothetical protein
MTEFMELVSNHTISNCVLQGEDEDEIIISFNGTLRRIRLFAAADCCSHSWFDYDFELDTLIGKMLVDIDEGEEVDRGCGDKETDIILNFTDRSTVKFVLINSSNGLYSGWLDVAII